MTLITKQANTSDLIASIHNHYFNPAPAWCSSLEHLSKEAYLLSGRGINFYGASLYSRVKDFRKKGVIETNGAGIKIINVQSFMQCLKEYHKKRLYIFKIDDSTSSLGQLKAVNDFLTKPETFAEPCKSLDQLVKELYLLSFRKINISGASFSQRCQKMIDAGGVEYRNSLYYIQNLDVCEKMVTHKKIRSKK